MTFVPRIIVLLLAIVFVSSNTATAQDDRPHDAPRAHKRGGERGPERVGPRFGPDKRRPPMPPAHGPGADRQPNAGPGRPPGGHGGRFGHLRPDFDSLKQRDPEMHRLLKTDHDLDRQTRDLARQFREAPQDRRAEIREQLEKVVNDHFDARQKRRALELDRLNKELERLKSAIEQRNTARDAIVGKRVTELVGEEGTLDF